MKMEAAANVWGIGTGQGGGGKGTLYRFTLSQPRDRLCPSHYYLPRLPPPGFSELPTALNVWGWFMQQIGLSSPEKMKTYSPHTAEH